MAKLCNLLTGEIQIVEPEHSFGRAPTSSAQVDASYVSAQHAALRWTGGRWVLRDLGSRNGTYLSGDRLTFGEERPVRTGMKLTFGKPNENAWELVDDGPPSVMAVPITGGEPVLLSGELLAVPSADDPQVTIYHGSAKPWLLDRPDDAT